MAPASPEARFVAAVAVLVFRGPRLLALRRSPAKDAAPGAWEALSGRIQAGEQPLDAARRETREECGLETTIEPRPFTAYQAKRGAEDMVVIAYRAEAGPGDVVLSDEHDAFRWVTPDEFAGLCRFDALVAAARQAAALPAPRS